MEWLVFALVAATAITIDLLLSRGKEPTMKAAIIQTLLYVSLALAFGGFIWWYLGASAVVTYLTGYVIEYTLSIDNIFVIGAIMTSMAIPAAKQRTLLYMGIVGAVILRGVFIMLGGAVIGHLSFVLPMLGLLLLGLGVKVFLSKEDGDEEPKMVARVRKLGIPVFGAALIAIEVTDLIFAIDSLPAIFGITTVPFLVFAASLMAVMGLRSLFFCLQGMKGKFHHLPKALGVVLFLIGVKIILPFFGIHIPVIVGLIVTVLVIALGIAASLRFPKKESKAQAA